jgi:hypothetical protein
MIDLVGITNLQFFLIKKNNPKLFYEKLILNVFLVFKNLKSSE